jgi:hypothetical protein
MSPERSPETKRQRPTAEKRRQRLEEQMIYHSTETYDELERAVVMAYQAEERRPNMAPYAGLIGPVRISEQVKVRIEEQPFLRRVIALQIRAMPRSIPSGLNHEVVDHASQLVRGELKELDSLDEDITNWSANWRNAAITQNRLNQAIEKHQHSSS